jgi:opacity protein-like surface antigen
MKKIIIATFLAAFSFTSASAELGVNVGVSGTIGAFAATATEKELGRTSASDERRQDSDFLALGWNSIFVEKTFADRLMIGIDYVPSALETEEKVETRFDILTKAENATGVTGGTLKTQKIKVEFKDLTTAYVGIMITEGLYVKAGLMQVDIITKENLGTGSTYKDTDMDGYTVGLGYNYGFDNGMFVRAEGKYAHFDGAALDSSTGRTRISLDGLDGATGTVSIGLRTYFHMV